MAEFERHILEQCFSNHFISKPKIFSWTGELSPSVPERVYYNKDQGTIESYFTKINQITDTSSPLIHTAQVSQAVDTLTKYLTSNAEHFLLIGPHGSAKRYL